MSVLKHLGAFSSALYRDSHLKNRIIVWTFVSLVLPAALLLTAGLPEKVVYIAVAALVLPLQFAVYSFSRPKRQTTIAEYDATWDALIAAVHAAAPSQITLSLNEKSIGEWQDSLVPAVIGAGEKYTTQYDAIIEALMTVQHHGKRSTQPKKAEAQTAGGCTAQTSAFNRQPIPVGL